MTTTISTAPNDWSTGDPELDALLFPPGSEKPPLRCCHEEWPFPFANREIGRCNSCGDHEGCDARNAEKFAQILPWKCFGGGPHMLTRTVGCGFEECGLMDDCKTASDRLFKFNPLLRAKFHDLARKITSAETYLASPATSTVEDAAITKEAEVIAPSVKSIGVASGAGVTLDTSALIDEPETEMAAKTKATSVASAASVFPVDELSFQTLKESYDTHTTPELRSLASKCSHGTVPSAEEVLPYSEVRERFLAASLVLNERGEIAPQFRERRRLSHKIVSEEDQTYSRDLRVIDMHWLYCHHEPNPVSELAAIFGPDEFRFDLAWQYACKRVTDPIRAQFLGLGGFEEHCLSMINDKETKQTWKRLHERRGAIIRRIKDALRQPSSRQKTDPAQLYDVLRALEAMDGITSSARELFAFMGHPRPTKTDFDRKVKWLCQNMLWPLPSSSPAA